MRKATLLAVMFLAAAAVTFAVPADVTYTDGDTTLKLKSGKTQDAQIGDKLNTGDTLRTGKDGQAELDQGGVTIKINSGTVFTLMEREAGGKTQTVLSMALGSIKYKYGKISGSEPAVRTNGAVAGVRGTEFTVFSGADGSTLIAVDSGQVDVESEGKTVQLAAAEGVEVPLGQPPGDKFVVHSDQINYSKWNTDKLSGMLADPEAAMANIETAMAAYAKDTGDYAASFKEYGARLATERTSLADIIKTKGADEGRRFEDENVSPLMRQTLALGLNLRYSELAALSLRRFVSGRLYVYLKAQFISQPDSEAWQKFLSRYSQFLKGFEESIAGHLVEADI
jgi:hypothetical protein